MSAEVHSETELYRVESRSARKLIWIETIDALATCLWRALPPQRRERRQEASVRARTLGSARASRVAIGALANRQVFHSRELEPSGFERGFPAGAPETAREGACAPQKIELQLDHLRRMNILARMNFVEQLFARGGVEIQHGEGGAASLISTE